MEKLFLISILITTLFISCDPYPQDNYEEFYVVESYLIADRELPQVRLSTTIEADRKYEFEDVSVSNAQIEIRLLETGPESNVEEVFSYGGTRPGIYQPNQDHRVLPGRTYEIYITFNENDDVISSTTIVPGGFEILAGVRDSIVYQSTEQLQITLSESFYPGRQNIFVFNALTDDPNVDQLTPLYASFLEDSDNPQQELELLTNNSSGIINQANFESNPDGSTTIDYPWIGIAFYGDNRIVANTLDDNVYDFVRSQQVQLGGTTLSPGEIQNAIYHVEGGIGVFGSLASDTVSTFVKRNPALNN
jgi:hypothetical protein